MPLCAVIIKLAHTLIGRIALSTGAPIHMHTRPSVHVFCNGRGKPLAVAYLPKNKRIGQLKCSCLSPLSPISGELGGHHTHKRVTWSCWNWRVQPTFLCVWSALGQWWDIQRKEIKFCNPPTPQSFLHRTRKKKKFRLFAVIWRAGFNVNPGKCHVRTILKMESTFT